MNKNFVAALALIISALSIYFISPDNKPVVYLIGDSTMADKPLDDNPERGWGQVLPLLLDPKVKVENYAKNGRSTKSFISDGLWARVYNKIKKDDYVIIQFGHNDAKIEDTTRYAAPNTLYKSNLIKFVNETRSKGGIPVLLTPITRRWFDEDNKLKDMHAPYAKVVKEVADSLKVPFIDMYTRSQTIINKLGPEVSKKLYLWVDSAKYKALPNGKRDDTHFTRTGAFTFAALALKGMKENNLSLANYIRDVDNLEPEGNVIVALDYYFNNEYKKGEDGKPVRYHYTWEDRENSGFNVLGNIFENYGARLSEIKTAPTKEELSKTSVYIIVDPDTPAETDSLHYIDDASIKKITDWVNAGGVLLLMANDSSNCEFKHLNELSSKFGITFNEVRENPVTGNNYEMGKFDNLPANDLFTGVSKIYMKEVCTLSLTDKAESLLTRDGKNYIASSKYGKGFVLAVCDPWIYNEYIDSRKIPESFQNYNAAVNLVKLLISRANEIK